MSWRNTMLGTVIATLLLLGSCSGITEGDKLALDQSVKAGRFIKETSSEPVIARAGADVEANDTTVQFTVGKPEEDVAYSPEASDAARKQSIEEHAEPSLFEKVAGWVGKLAGPFGENAVAIGLAVFAWWRKTKADRKLKAIAGSIEHGFAYAKDGKYNKMFKEGMKVYHIGKGTYAEVSLLIKQLKAKKKIIEAKDIKTPPIAGEDE